jgi:YVTN family beta-propeller protein
MLAWLWGADGEATNAELARQTPLTWAIGALLVVTWLASEVLPGHDAVRRALGGSGYRVAEGEWWRLFTPTLLNTRGPNYGPLRHLVFNEVALLLVGPRVERLLGRARFLALWLVAEVLGRAWLVFHFAGPGGFGGGTSIFTVALQAVAFADAVRRRRESAAIERYVQCFAVAIAVQVVLAFTQGDPVDNNAHAAGAIAGLVILIGVTAHRRWATLASYGLVAVAGLTLATYRTVDLHRTSSRVQAVIDVGGRPFYVTSGFGSLWVSNYDDATVSRVDPRANRVVATIKVGRLASGIAAGPDAVWVVGESRSLVRIDPATNRVVARIPVPRAASDVAVTAGAVWVSSVDANVVTRIDPTTNRVAGRVDVRRGPYEIDTEGKSVWVANLESESVSRVDAASGEVAASIGTDGGPHDVVAREGNVWVASRVIERIDPATNQVVEQGSDAFEPFLLALDGTNIWATRYNNTLARVDGRTLRVVERVRLGLVQSSGVTVADGAVWVTDVYRGRLLRLLD